MINELDSFINANLITILKWGNKYNNPKSEQPFDFDDLRHCIIFQLIRYAYEQYLPKDSIRSYLELNTSSTDSQRARYSRLIKYAQYYRDVQNEEIKEIFGESSKELENRDMSKMENKMTGYNINKMRFFELDMMGNIKLLKSIVNLRICDVKKVSNTEFKEMMDEYDKLVEELLQKLEGSDEDILFSTVALYTLEWRYNVELFYSCSVEAEMKHTKDISEDRIGILCAILPLSIRPVVIESRFVLNRLKVVPYVYNADIMEWEKISRKYELYLNATDFYTKYETDNTPAMEKTFAKKFDIHEAAEYIRKNYDIRKMYKKKEWTSARIKYVRNLYLKFYKDIKPPKIK